MEVEGSRQGCRISAQYPTLLGFGLGCLVLVILLPLGLASFKEPSFCSTLILDP